MQKFSVLVLSQNEYDHARKKNLREDIWEASIIVIKLSQNEFRLMKSRFPESKAYIGDVYSADEINAIMMGSFSTFDMQTLENAGDDEDVHEKI
jgi:hypothetical protein